MNGRKVDFTPAVVLDGDLIRHSLTDDRDRVERDRLRLIYACGASVSPLRLVGVAVEELKLVAPCP